MARETTGLSGLAGRYAVALYDLAETASELDRVADDLRALRGMLVESADLTRLIRSPVVGRDDQQRAIAAVTAKAGFADLTGRFLGVLTQNRRLFALPAMIDAYLARLAAKRGEVVAQVTSAQPLNDVQLGRVTDALRRSLGAKVLIDAKVDPGLIGGLVVRVGSRLVDHSLKSKLARLGLAMKGVG